MVSVLSHGILGIAEVCMITARIPNFLLRSKLGEMLRQSAPTSSSVMFTTFVVKPFGTHFAVQIGIPQAIQAGIPAFPALVGTVKNQLWFCHCQSKS